MSVNVKQVAVVGIAAAIAIGISVSGNQGGLRRVSVQPGMLAGSGLTTNPLTVTVTKGAGWTGTGSNGDPLVLTRTWDGGLFGDGWDGTCTFDGTTTVGNPASSTFAPVTCSTGLHTPRGCDVQGTGPQGNKSTAITKAYIVTRDIYCETLTVSSGVYVYHPGVKIFARGGIVNNGWIGAQGQPPAIGSESNAGVQGAQTTVSTGADGGAQGAPGGSGNNGVPTRLKNAGGTGGDGGRGGDGFAPGVGGGLGTNTVADSFDPITNMIGFIGTQHASLPARMGGGGGGGRGDGFSGCAGGGGGSAGGVVIVAAPTFTGSGYLSAPGGNGANGSDTCPGGVRQGGGGGGGKGGWIIYVYSTGSPPNTDVSGGLHGDQSPGAALLQAATDGSSGLVTYYKIGPQ